MSYLQLFASSDDWLVSEEATVYQDDTDHATPGKLREVLRHFTLLAQADKTLVTVHTVSHPHLDDGRECNCASYGESVLHIDERDYRNV